MNHVKQIVKGIVWSAVGASAIAAVILIGAYYHVMSFVR